MPKSISGFLSATSLPYPNFAIESNDTPFVSVESLDVNWAPITILNGVSELVNLGKVVLLNIIYAIILIVLFPQSDTLNERWARLGYQLYPI